MCRRPPFLLARLTTLGLLSSPARIAASPGLASAGVTSASWPHAHGPMLLGSNPHIPPTVQSKRIYRNDAIFIRQFVEPGKPLHVGRALIHAMQQDHHWIG